MDRQRDWSSLPPDLLFTISNRLYSKITLLCFRAVCHSWRSSSIPLSSSSFDPPLSLQIPLSGLSYDSDDDDDDDDEDEELDNVRHVLITESNFYFVQPLNAEIINISKAFVIKEIGDTYFHSKYFISLPFLYDDDDDKFINFPLCQVSHKWCTEFNVVDFRISEIANGFQLMGKNDDSDEFNVYISFKVVASSYSLSEVGDGFAVMVMDDYYDSYYLWRFGDENWKRFMLEDLVEIGFHKGKFYVVDRNGITIAVDPKNFEIEIAAAEICSKCFESCTVYLVEFHGDLYLIEKLEPDDFDYPRAGSVDYPRAGSVPMNIWVLDEKKKEWDELRLKNHVLYVSAATAQIFKY